MNFFINMLILWQSNGTKRVLEFKVNHVNVITGDSGTGKSSVINIIDYCLLGSEPHISETMINSKVDWYGLDFCINDKHFVIARGKVLNNAPSGNLYFSGIGEIPDIPTVSIKEAELKTILESEFGLDSNAKFEYGGNAIRQGSKISFRYFLLFNTQTFNVLTNSSVLFDRMEIDRYREALGRIFDLSIAMDSIEGVLVKDRIEYLYKELVRLERKQDAFEQQSVIFKDELTQTCRQAKALGFIDESLSESEFSIEILNIHPEALLEEGGDITVQNLDILLSRRSRLQHQLSKYRAYLARYKDYKQLMRNRADSLEPVNFLMSLIDKVDKTSDTFVFLKFMEDKLSETRSALAKRSHSPVEISLKEQTEKLTKEINELDREIRLVQEAERKAEVTVGINRFLALGQIQERARLYNSKLEDRQILDQIATIQAEIDRLKDKLITDEHKDFIKQLFNERIQQYISQSIIEGYSDKPSTFNFSKKQLDLRDADSSIKYPMPSIGSSSNYLFLHLSFFLGTHDHILRENVSFVPSFLILDQVSSPYYVKSANNSYEESDDWEKLARALSMLNEFINRVAESGKNFQIILLEHIPEEMWLELGLNRFSLVDREFRNGCKLVM